MNKQWRWIAARSIGTSHLKSGSVCQDAWCCAELPSVENNVLVAVVSDGAGSACYAEIGSKIVCTSIMRCCRDFLSKNPLSALTEDDAREWVDIVRDRIFLASQKKEACEPRSYAATLVAVLSDEQQTIVLHVGDGAVVVRKSPNHDWEVPSWPFQGEYASTTAFVTDKPHARLVFTLLDEPISDFAVFSDGIERMVLNQAEQTAFSPFFDRMIAPLEALEEGGRNKKLSLALQDYLDTPKVCERTDDDKTLILGARL